jgi:hypothetical protein
MIHEKKDRGGYALFGDSMGIRRSPAHTPPGGPSEELKVYQHNLCIYVAYTTGISPLWV